MAREQFTIRYKNFNDMFRTVKLAKKLRSLFVLILLLIGMLSTASTFRDVVGIEQEGYTESTIYINEDGSITCTRRVGNQSLTPPAPPIRPNDAHDTFTFTDNINMSIYVEKNGVVIDGSGYTIQVAGVGIRVIHRAEIKICNLIVENCSPGIDLISSSDTTIQNNTIIYCGSVGTATGGIHLDGSFRNNILGNIVMENHWAGIGLEGGSHDNTIINNSIIGNDCGFRAEASPNCLFQRNIVRDNHPIGILSKSDQSKSKLDNLTVTENDIQSNGIGIWLWGSRGGTLYHNNLLDNNVQVSVHDSQNNTWDNGLEGNFWSDYNGIDNNTDGIGETQHWIDGNKTENNDCHPLMGVFNQSIIIGEHEFYDVEVISNCTTSMMNPLSLKLNVVSGAGFCRMCIPNKLAEPPYTLVLSSNQAEGSQLEYRTITSNLTHTWIYFEYPYSGTATVAVIGANKPPPFWLQSWFGGCVVLAVIATAIAAIGLRRNAGKRKGQRRKVEVEFNEDVRRREPKIKRFSEEHQMDIKPSENLGDALIKNGIDRKKKRRVYH